MKRAVYLLLTLSGTALWNWAGGPIHLKTRDLTAASYPAADTLSGAGLGPGHLLLQFSSPPLPADLRELQRRGARIVGSAPDGGVTIATDQPLSLHGLPVEWAGPLLPKDKISPLLAAVERAPAAVVVEFHGDVYPRRALQIMRSLNLQVLRHPDLASNHLLVSAPAAAWPQIAEFDEVAYIFPASADLIQGNRVMSCAGALMSQGPVGQYVTMGSGWGGAGADGVVELEYVFTEMSAALPVASAQSEILRALDEWAKYANVRFVPGSSATDSRTVAIMFAQGVHGDGYPFTPGSPVLAHTFFPSPPNAESIAGDMHLNADQPWHIGSDVDLYTVALHEAGHALGLGHVDDPNAVMYPYYRFGAVLSDGDIAGVQSLYGGASTPANPVIPSVTVAITNPAGAAVSTTASSISLSGTAAGGTGVQVAWSNSAGGSGQATGSAGWSIGSVPLIPGQNTITVVATDSKGRSASATLVVTRQVSAPPVTPPTVTPPAGPPSVTITSPAMSIVSTSASTITVSGAASASVTSVTWTTSTGGSGSATGTQSWSASIPLLVGTNTVTILGANAAGATAWRSLTVVRH